MVLKREFFGTGYHNCSCSLKASRLQAEGYLGLRHFLPVQLGLREKFKFQRNNCAKFVHAHSRKPHPNILRELCRCTPAQISHNLSTFLDAPAHLSHKFSGTCRECPAHKFCTIFSGTWPVQAKPMIGKPPLLSRTPQNAGGQKQDHPLH